MRVKFLYTGILVRDLERSIRFYTKQLGMRLLFRQKIPETGGEVAWLRPHDSRQVVELNWYPRDEEYPPNEHLDHLGFEVPDADTAYRALLRAGAKSARPPFDEGRWRLAFVEDPDGAWIELGSRRASHRRRKTHSI